MRQWHTESIGPNAKVNERIAELRSLDAARAMCVVPDSHGRGGNGIEKDGRHLGSQDARQGGEAKEGSEGEASGETKKPKS